MTAELGRQPWIVYGLMRTSDAVSPVVAAGDGWLSIGLFSVVYLLLFAMFLFLLDQKIKHGPLEEGPRRRRDRSREGPDRARLRRSLVPRRRRVVRGYAVLDGFDLGVGALHLFARTDEHRRLMLNSIGPVWDGNEVWLVVGGGALFAAFPNVYATVFRASPAMMLLLCALIFRAVAIEFRSKQPMRWWRQTWDVSFSVASIAASLLLGVALQQPGLRHPARRVRGECTRRRHSHCCCARTRC